MGEIRVNGTEQKKTWNIKQNQKGTKRTEEETSPAPPRTDSGSFLSQKKKVQSKQDVSPEDADLQQAAKECFDYLKQRYPGIHYSLVMLSGTEDLTKYAQTAGKGTFLAVDVNFLRKMMESPEQFQRGLDLLEQSAKMLSLGWPGGGGAVGRGAMAGGDGKISFWSLAPPESDEDDIPDQIQKLIDSMKDQREQLEAMRVKNQQARFTCKKKVGYSASRDLMMLARAGTVQNVRSLIVRVYANATSLKMGSSQYDKEEVRRAKAQMEGVILRAKVKVKKLKEESLEDRKIKKIEQKQRLAMAKRLKAELEKKRAIRRSREYRQVNDFITSEYFRARKSEEEAKQAEIQANLISAGIDTGAAVSTVSGSAPSSGTGETGGGTGTVTVVSTSMNLSV